MNKELLRKKTSMKNTKEGKNKGITLIALIITIIIMLILVGVTIQVAVNSNLFETAEGATQDWDATQQQEKNLAGGKVTIDNVTYNSIDEYFEANKQGAGNEDDDALEISFTYSHDMETWINEDITVTASVAGNEVAAITNEESQPLQVALTQVSNTNIIGLADEYEIEMKREGEDWTKTNSLTVSQNGKVYARVVKDGNQIGEVHTADIKNIDKEMPAAGKIEVYEDETEIDKMTLTNNSLSVSSDYNPEIYVKFINGVDNENGSGILKTTYSISYYGSVQYVYVFDDTTTTLPLLQLDLNDASPVMPRFGGSGMETEYTISIETIDKAGNTATDQYTITISGSDEPDV